eukprot:Skav203377  [mRNA]  locus=scaffold3573:2116:5712:- [translate_table: standard]
MALHESPGAGEGVKETPDREGTGRHRDEGVTAHQKSGAATSGLVSPILGRGESASSSHVSPFLPGQNNSQDLSGLGRFVAEKGADLSAKFQLRDVFNWLGDRMSSFCNQLCRVSTTGKIFPLPSSYVTLAKSFHDADEDELNALRVLVLGLNSLNGEGLECEKMPSQFQLTILSGLLNHCKRVLAWKEVGERFSWEAFFKVKGVDYKGDEVLSAQKIAWENVESALPLEVGGVPLQSVVDKGSLNYVLNFEKFLLDPQDQTYVRPPRVMVDENAWETLCSNLLSRGVFDRIHEDDVHQVQGRLLLNGLFGVSKHEYTAEGREVMRIIMNLIPVNTIVRTLDSDIATLPTWSGMSPLELMVDESLVVSSEDVRCFFYIFKIPQAWHKYMAFNKPLPQSLSGSKPGKWYPCSAVLPMGFKNSVSLAQHIHRLLAQQALVKAGLGGECELRKDRSFTFSNPSFRVYLDNFDELRRVSKTHANLIEGKISPLVAGLREVYQEKQVPRHPKKGVASQLQAEVQGAIVDGDQGVIYPKPEKILRYLHLTTLLLKADTCTQKQLQIVGGGLVYFCMFRRPLLGGLNHLWKFIHAFDGLPPVVRLAIPDEVREELARMVALVPLAFIDLRCKLSKVVTASDASTTGGGVTVSQRVTAQGAIAAQCDIRGDVVEPVDLPQVLTVGIFDGISGLRVATDVLGWSVAGHISIEKSAEASRVVESRFPNTVFVPQVEDVSEAEVISWSLKFSQVALVAIGAGPPCQGVSGLNASKKGALKDARSSLFFHVRRLKELFQKHFPWAQVRVLMESVASMNAEDEAIMSADYGGSPVYIDSSDVSPAHRPRLYWIDWELLPKEDVSMSTLPSDRTKVSLKATWSMNDYLLPGWTKADGAPFPTFTTARPRNSPGYKPAGLHQCSSSDLEMWERDLFRFPPYQYQERHCVYNSHGDRRLVNCEEREVMMGFPRHYTLQCFPKSQQGTVAHSDCRLTLIGNSWNVTTIAVLLSHLGEVLGLNPALSVQDIVQRTAPGSSKDFQTFLQRPFMRPPRKAKFVSNELLLVRKLVSLVGIKGDDLLLQPSSEDVIRYHRLRASVPARLWKWRTVAGWSWSEAHEHINVLELRAALTALRWRIEKQEIVHSKFVHLLDSLVCLHALSRGRSSSRKLKRTLLRMNALILATDNHVVWAYVHTKDNPADRPSRRPQKRKWSHA